MTTSRIKRHMAWYALSRGETVGREKNGSGVRSVNAGRTRSALTQMALCTTYATTVSGDSDYAY